MGHNQSGGLNRLITSKSARCKESQYLTWSMFLFRLSVKPVSVMFPCTSLCTLEPTVYCILFSLFYLADVVVSSLVVCETNVNLDFNSQSSAVMF